ncbi:CDP-alcohol phosphatidyltransferase family protein [Microbulbifer sp.]|uniref:CDP-alcohol phosphatidyltransferase family protein n=1 Tax=Microbulbifer sp. TaxID=1908541 RepID=UPI00258BD8DA|nr:CDP-alcohol phosphatidyltransferase family protein [Microbulbifer sp.]
MSQASASRWRQIPNALSFLRLLLIPPIVYLSLHQYDGLALSLYIVAALSDYADGWLARRYHWQSRFGMILDPLADRIFVLSMIPLLWYLDTLGLLYGIVLGVRCLLQASVVPVVLLWLKRPFGIRAMWLQLFASVTAYTVLGLGFADEARYLWLPSTSGARFIFERTVGAMTFIGLLLEVAVLIRFAPRYLHVLQKRKNTFE